VIKERWHFSCKRVYWGNGKFELEENRCKMGDSQASGSVTKAVGLGICDKVSGANITCLE
jgi:hypothetical protein